MFKYNYELIDRNNNKITHNYIILFDKNKNVAEEIYLTLLENKRKDKYNLLLSKYGKHFEIDPEDLYTLEQIKKRYIIRNIYLASQCYGCINDCGGQKDHMECPSGCLHSPEDCFNCLFSKQQKFSKM